MVSEKLCVSHCKSLETNDPWGGVIFDPRGTVDRMYKKTTTKHCYTQNMKALGPVVLKNSLYVFPMTPQGRGLYGPQGHGWQDL